MTIEVAVQDVQPGDRFGGSATYAGEEPAAGRWPEVEVVCEEYVNATGDRYVMVYAAGGFLEQHSYGAHVFVERDGPQAPTPAEQRCEPEDWDPMPCTCTLACLGAHLVPDTQYCRLGGPR